jgi:hypothetical protein
MSLVGLPNIDLYRSCSFANEDQNLLAPKCALPAARENGNKIDALTDASRNKCFLSEDYLPRIICCI